MASRPYINWQQLLTDLTDLLGVDTWTKARREQVANTIGVSETTIDRVCRDLKALGFFDSRGASGGVRVGPDGRKSPIRAQEWKISADPETIFSTAKQRGFEFGKSDSHGTGPKKKSVEVRADGGSVTSGPLGKYEGPGPRGYEPVKKVEQPVKPSAGVVGEYVFKPETTSNGYVRSDDRYTDPEDYRVQEEEDRHHLDVTTESPFAVLKPLRKDEAAAMIEAARQYQSKMSFINEEIDRFAEHGITLDPAVIGFPRDQQLEVIGQVLTYVTTLEKQAERNMAQSSGSAEIGELKTQIKRQQATIEELVRDRAERDRDATRLANQWSGKEKTLKDKIEHLEQELHDAKRQPVGV